MGVADEATLDARLLSLEALRMDVADLPLQERLERLSKRQELLDELQSFDTTALSSEARARFRVRVEQLLSDNNAALQGLKEQYDAARKKQGHLVQARSAARGYRPDLSDQGRAVNRKA